MEESEQARGEDESKPIFRDITLDQLCRGARFAMDIENDFELDDLDITDEESDEDEFWRLGTGLEKQDKPANLHTPPNVQELTDAAENVTPDGGVRKLILQKGTRVKPPAGARVFFHYVGFVAESLEKFDASTQKGGQRVMLDDDSCGLIRGFRIALKTMEIHEVAQFLLQSDYAYGPIGCPPRIPPGCQMIFNIRLVHCLLPEELDNPIYMTRQELKNVEFSKVVEAAKGVRDTGTVQYKNNNYSKAARSYRQAIDLLEDYWNVTDEQELERGDSLACCFANLAAALLHLKKGPQACNACKLGLRQPSTKYRGKLLYRFAKAKLLVDSFGHAHELVTKARKAGAVEVDCDKLEKEIQIAKDHSAAAERQMSELMFGTKRKTNVNSSKSAKGA